jgi:2-dehydro-3-deoxyphosphogluconate aldolase/(4S)-4-hydroxy-2-oxoglutarate aldolase
MTSLTRTSSHDVLEALRTDRAAGATAVCAGTSVVPPAAVMRGDWTEITERARTFVAALDPSLEP